MNAIRSTKRDPWMPDTPIPATFYKNGKLKKDAAFYAWIDSEKETK